MRLIDVMHLGRPHVIGAWLVGDVVIDPGPTSCLETLVEGLGGERPRALLLTHIHLNHAGASGSLVERWPDLEVYVHERGARHMVSPDRLLESARQLYGEDMDRLWGEMVPVPETNVRVLSGGERLFDGEFEVAYTPGHASHHVSFLHDGTAFVGDVGGARIAGSQLTIPPTPPPDIDVEKWHASIELIRTWKPRRTRGAAGRLGGSRAWAGPRCVRRRGAGRDRGARGSRHRGGIRTGGAARPAVRRPSALLAQAGRGRQRPVSLRSAAMLPEMSQTVELPRVGGPGGDLGELWRVVVLNDEHNTFDHVAETLSRVIPGVSLAQGYRLADQIHKTGLAIVWSGPRDEAQQYWEQLDGAGLTMAPLEVG